MQAVIYVDKTQNESLKQIKQQARDEHHGLGYILIRAWEELQEIKSRENVK
jgi:hypothetical protein